MSHPDHNPGHAGLTPWDVHNQTLVANAHPPDWVTPAPAPRYHLVVIGAGTAGLVAAAGAAGLGARVAVVERHLMGGDCLNVGCVPSKCLLRSAGAMADIGQAARFGITVPPGTEADFAAVMERLRRIRARLSPHDSARRFRELGVDVFLGHGTFVGPKAIQVAGHTLRFRRAVIATGARAVEPAIPGLAAAGFLTNETVFNLTSRPRRLAVIGGGPIGCELAQAFRRLGCEVTLFHQHACLLEREDDDAAAIVEASLRSDGVQLVLESHLRKVERSGDGKLIHYDGGGKSAALKVDEILAGAGRAPNVEGLGLELAGVDFDPRAGVRVNDRLQTTNSHIYAAGDVCTRWKFTHAADFTARLVIQNALFLGRKKLSALTIPRCTYTDPEVAHVGLHERGARERGIALDTWVRRFKEVDRAVTDGAEEGFVKIHTRKGSDRIVGATIVGRHAGDLISEISVAMAAKMGLGRLASVIHPYPTRADAIRQLGDAFNRTRLTPAVKRLFQRWLDWTG
jgi:pyruvate/2-oxoglutarate dehydrogenase complex dihydrolipoamide dehydrogenase (E3) component